MKLIFFTTCKDFTNEYEFIQPQSILSWNQLNCEKQIIIIGDDIGSSDFCKKHNFTFEPEIRKFDGYVPYLKDMFLIAEKYADDDDIIIWTNADMMYFDDMVNSIKHIDKNNESFCIVGRRYDWTKPRLLDKPIDNIDQILKESSLHAACGIDFVATKKGILTKSISDKLIIAGGGHDMKLLGYAKNLNIPTFDISNTCIAIHHNHSRPKPPQGRISNNGSVSSLMLSTTHCKYKTKYDQNKQITY